MRNTHRAPPAPANVLPRRAARAAARHGARQGAAYTPSTLTDPALLRRELERIRSVGHALDNEEFAAGLKCLAAPLRDHTRRVVASLGIAGPAVRFAEERVPRLAALVREAAAGASAALGFASADRD